MNAGSDDRSRPIRTRPNARPRCQVAPAVQALDVRLCGVTKALGPLVLVSWGGPVTRRPYLDERDPAEPREWVESSSPGIRRLALAQTAAAVKAARDKKPISEESTDE